jgi:hypothetical protein
MEKGLKNEARMKLVTAALTGAALDAVEHDGRRLRLVDYALVVADDAIRRITETA